MAVLADNFAARESGLHSRKGGRDELYFFLGFALALSGDVLVDSRFLHEGIENVEDTVRAPYRTSFGECCEFVVGL